MNKIKLKKYYSNQERSINLCLKKQYRYEVNRTFYNKQKVKKVYEINKLNEVIKIKIKKQLKNKIFF